VSIPPGYNNGCTVFKSGSFSRSAEARVHLETDLQMALRILAMTRSAS
jgi:hypothetical protein